MNSAICLVDRVERYPRHGCRVVEWFPPWNAVTTSLVLFLLLKGPQFLVRYVVSRQAIKVKFWMHSVGSLACSIGEHFWPVGLICLARLVTSLSRSASISHVDCSWARWPCLGNHLQERSCLRANQRLHDGLHAVTVSLVLFVLLQGSKVRGLLCSLTMVKFSRFRSDLLHGLRSLLGQNG